MKKYLLLTMAIAGTLIAGAASPDRHGGTLTQSGLKEINRQHHAATPRIEKVKQLRAAEEAPAE